MLRNIFLNDRELRAGWRFATYLALIIALGCAAYFSLRLLLGPGHVSVGRTSELYVADHIVTDSALFVMFLIPALIMGRMERRSLGDYGLPRRGAFGAHFWEGIVWGIGLMATTMLVLVDFGVCHIGDLAVSAGAGLKYGLAWAIAFMLVGLAEEFAFRGYTLFTLTAGVGFWPAALILSGAFALAHLPAGETWLGVLQDFLAGMMFALPLRRTGALWFSIGLHAGWDWMQTFFFGVSIGGMRPHGYLLNTSFSGSAWLSGGSLGPGNSVITIAVFGLALMLLHFRFPRTQYPRPATLNPSAPHTQPAPVVAAPNP